MLQRFLIMNLRIFLKRSNVEQGVFSATGRVVGLVLSIVLFFSNASLPAWGSTGHIARLKRSSADAGCKGKPVLDFYYIQDDTASFTGLKEVLRNQMEEFFDRIEGTFPGSRYGMAVFADQSRSLGEGQESNCQAKVASFDFSYKPILQYLSTQFNPHGGDDIRAEDSLTAINLAAVDGSVAWRPYGNSTQSNQFVLPVIFVVTDALFEFTLPSLPGLSEVGGDPYEGDPPRCATCKSVPVDYVCGTNDYASIQGTKEALDQKNIYPVVVSVDDTQDGWKLLIQEFKRGAVGNLAYNGSNLASAGMEALSELVCSRCQECDLSYTPSRKGGKGAVAGVAIGAAAGGVIVLAAAGYGAYTVMNKPDAEEESMEVEGQDVEPGDIDEEEEREATYTGDEDAYA